MASGSMQRRCPSIARAERVRIPGLGNWKHPAAICFRDRRRRLQRGQAATAIEAAYQRVTLEARNQYTLGYNTRFTASGTSAT